MSFGRTGSGDGQGDDRDSHDHNRRADRLTTVPLLHRAVLGHLTTTTVTPAKLPSYRSASGARYAGSFQHFGRDTGITPSAVADATLLAELLGDLREACF